MIDSPDDAGEERIAKFERNSHLLPAFADGPEAEAAWPPLDAAAALDRAKGCLLGLAIGEALGAPHELQPRGSFDEISGLTSGEWSDGTAMALCLGQSIVANGSVDQYDFMSRLQAWLMQGQNTVHGASVAVGATTRTAIESFIQDDDPAAGPVEGDTAGNGSLIRLAPLAIFSAGKGGAARFLAGKQSRATHGTLECLDACELFTAQLVDALNGADKAAATRPRVMQLAPNTLAINAGEYKPKTREQIASGAYVIETLEAALWAVGQCSNFRDTVLLAVNLGGDPAGVAAVAGQLAGALYGAGGIPQEWLQGLAWREKLEQVVGELVAAGAAA